LKLKHATSVPPRGERECLGDDECAAAKTEKQNHKKGPDDAVSENTDSPYGRFEPVCLNFR
jgi:hypothetical protein